MNIGYATETAFVDSDWALAHHGSWTEYGSLIGAPIEKPVAVAAG